MSVRMVLLLALEATVLGFAPVHVAPKATTQVHMKLEARPLGSLEKAPTVTAPERSFVGLEPEALSSYPMQQLIDLGGYGPETGNMIWDPLRLASSENIGVDAESKLKWYRTAELKHGRISMLAFVGYIVGKLGICFDGRISTDGVGGGVRFADLVEANPFAEWANVPTVGKIQLFLLAAGIELAAEQNNINGGAIGEVPYPWNPFLPRDPPSDDRVAAKRAQSSLIELKNGRLAMIGIAGFYAAETVPGSIPLLTGSL